MFKNQHDTGLQYRRSIQFIWVTMVRHTKTSKQIKAYWLKNRLLSIFNYLSLRKWNKKIQMNNWEYSKQRSKHKTNQQEVVCLTKRDIGMSTWTMSLSAYLPLDEILTSSPSNSTMAEENDKGNKMPEYIHRVKNTQEVDTKNADSPSNSAGPTPTMIMDIGRQEAWREEKRRLLRVRSPKSHPPPHTSLDGFVFTCPGFEICTVLPPPHFGRGD